MNTKKEYNGTGRERKEAILRGGIYSLQKCHCGNNFRDNMIDGCVCPDHPDQRATKMRARFGTIFGPTVSSYQEAQGYLWEYRNKATDGSLNPASYRKDSPIGFARLCERYFEVLEDRGVRGSTLRRYRAHYANLENFLGNTPVTEISYGVLEDIKVDTNLKPKTTYDMFGFLKSFMRWCVDRGYLTKLCKFPQCKKKMGMRKILDKVSQAEVVRTAYRLFSHEPMVGLGIELLATYPKIRPGELRQVRLQDLDLVSGWLTVPRPKEQDDPKRVKLIDKHVDALREVTNGNHKQYLLSFKAGRRFGRDYLKNAWEKTCDALGIEGVSLYPGTKHTTATDLAKRFPNKMVKEAAGITSRAMERYIQIDEVDVVSLYESAAPKIDLH